MSTGNMWIGDDPDNYSGGLHGMPMVGGGSFKAPCGFQPTGCKNPVETAKTVNVEIICPDGTPIYPASLPDDVNGGWGYQAKNGTVSVRQLTYGVTEMMRKTPKMFRNDGNYGISVVMVRDCKESQLNSWCRVTDGLKLKVYISVLDGGGRYRRQSKPKTQF